MAGKYKRAAIVERLHAEIRSGRPIYDALCGSGITAKMAARGGADMVTTHCLAYFRMQGMSSMAGYLPICDANALTLELGERALVNVVRDCPLVAGLLCVDPTRDMARFLETIAAVGYDGVMNCPTVALIDGKFRSDLEETGMGFAREVADQLVFMDAGAVVESGDPTQVLANPQHERTKLFLSKLL